MTTDKRISDELHTQGADKIEELRADIERLTAADETKRKDRDMYLALYNEARARIATLEAQVEEMGGVASLVCKRFNEGWRGGALFTHTDAWAAAAKEDMHKLEALAATAKGESEIKYEAGSFMPKVDGKGFRCECGCNVFRRELGTQRYQCNACDAWYEGT